MSKGAAARYAAGLAAAAAVSVALPVAEVRHHCKDPMSEACVWGKALIKVNMAAHFVVIGIPLMLLVAWLLGRRRG